MAVAFILVALGGIFLLEKSERQQRDTTRKHHIADLEQALYFARGHHGTYPPYEEASWCGILSDAKNAAVLSQVEEALRTQHEQYENPAKPFPFDPKLSAGDTGDYFYWKRSPTSFELFAMLETDANGDRNTLACDNAKPYHYDYGITSVLREPGARQRATL